MDFVDFVLPFLDFCPCPCLAVACFGCLAFFLPGLASVDALHSQCFLSEANRCFIVNGLPLAAVDFAVSLSFCSLFCLSCSLQLQAGLAASPAHWAWLLFEVI